MRSYKFIFSVACALLLQVAPRVWALPASNSIQLLVSCENGNGGFLNNCFQDLESLNQWLSTRSPTPANPLRIEIGPGDFQGTFECKGKGGIAIEGAGRAASSITANMANLEPGIKASNCSGLSVAHLTIRGGYRAVHLGGNSVTTWTDVEILGGARGVYSTYNCDPSLTKHTWYNSRIEAIPRGMAIAYDARCGEHKIYSSELVANGSASQYGGIPNNVVALKADQTEKVTVHVVGSTLRALLSMPNSGAVPVSAIQADRGAEVLVVGSQIEAISNEAHDLWVLSANSGGVIRIDASSYKLTTVAPGVVSRINTNGGFVYAPYHWPVLPNPALVPGYRSQHGADTSTLMDTSDGHPHALVYDMNCPGEAVWYDQLDNVCR